MSEIIRVFDDNQIDYALCGGLAVAIHGHIRFTQDIDLIILPEDLEKAKDVLKITGYNLPSGIIPFKQKDGTSREILRLSKAMGKDLYTLDLMLCTGSLEDIWKDREVIETENQEFKVVSKSGLITMKREAGRNKDLLDIEELEKLG